MSDVKEAPTKLVSEKYERKIEYISKHGPGALALLLGITYTCGFLCVTTFLYSFGIHEPSLDFFKAKYIQAGAMFLAFPVCLLLPLVILVSRIHDAVKVAKTTGEVEKLDAEIAGNHGLIHDPEKIYKAFQDVEKKHPLRSEVGHLFGATLINTFFLLYIITIFFSHEFLLDKLYSLLLMFVSCLAFPIATIMLVRRVGGIGILALRVLGLVRYISIRTLLKSQRTMGWFALTCCIMVSNAFILKGHFEVIGKVLFGARIPTGLSYYLLIIAVPLVFWIINLRARAERELFRTERAKFELRAMFLPISLICVYFSIIAFATYLYPWIPASKSGGDYSEGPVVKIRFKVKPAEGIFKLDAAVPGGGLYGPYVVIEQTNDVIYLAGFEKDEELKRWREISREGGKRPSILEVRRDEIEVLLIAPRPQKK